MPNADKVILIGADGLTAASATNPVPVTAESSGGATHVIVDSGTLTAVTAITNALPVGANVIGHVIADTGSTTAVTGNVTVVQATGTNLHAVLDTTSTTAVTQATAGNLNATVVGTGTFAAQATLQTQTDTVMVGGVNIKEINAVAPLMGNGTTGTGSLRVTVASDNTAFSVNAAQATAASLNATVVGTGTFVVQNTTAAGENHIGEVGVNEKIITVAQTVTAAQYAAGNCVGGLITFATAARVSGASGASGTGGIIASVIIDCKSAQTTQMDVLFFNADPSSGSTITDKTAIAIATAQWQTMIGVAHVADWTSAGTPSVGQSLVSIPYSLASATSLFAVIVTRATPTFAATTDVSISIVVQRN